MKNRTKFYSKNLKKKDHFEDKNIDGRYNNEAEVRRFSLVD
jgi:hypothetical protein